MKLGNILQTLGRQFSVTISMPVTISTVIIDQSQIDAGFLSQVERNEKVFRRIQDENTVCEEYIRLITT